VLHKLIKLHYVAFRTRRFFKTEAAEGERTMGNQDRAQKPDNALKAPQTPDPEPGERFWFRFPLTVLSPWSADHLGGQRVRRFAKGTALSDG